MLDQSDRPLKLAKEFNEKDHTATVGYEKVDETTVLERKRVPVTLAKGGDYVAYIVTVFDFKQRLLTHLARDQYQNTTFPPTYRNFSDVEGKEAILDAHRALVLLGGTPPPIEEILGILNKPALKSPLFQRPGQEPG